MSIDNKSIFARNNPTIGLKAMPIKDISERADEIAIPIISTRKLLTSKTKAADGCGVSESELTEPVGSNPTVHASFLTSLSYAVIVCRLESRAG